MHLIAASISIKIAVLPFCPRRAFLVIPLFRCTRKGKTCRSGSYGSVNWQKAFALILDRHWQRFGLCLSWPLYRNDSNTLSIKRVHVADKWEKLVGLLQPAFFFFFFVIGPLFQLSNPVHPSIFYTYVICKLSSKTLTPRSDRLMQVKFHFKLFRILILSEFHI